MIYNLGSINADYFYAVPHLPAVGETIAATSQSSGLGGKGANQSVAVALAGAEVCHIGAVGSDGAWAVERMKGYGVDVRHIATVKEPTAHAIINVDPSGENAIVIYSGANNAQDESRIAGALNDAQTGDVLVLQNETSHQVEAAKLAASKGMRVIYSAAPFDLAAVRAILPHVSVLIVNEVEAAQLSEALGVELSEVPVENLLMTKGAKGAEWLSDVAEECCTVPAFEVTPVDTTGAGDTFAGYFIAGTSEGMQPSAAMRLASAAAALKVTRAGTADAIPTRQEVERFLA